MIVIQVTSITIPLNFPLFGGQFLVTILCAKVASEDLQSWQTVNNRFYVLKYNTDLKQKYWEGGGNIVDMTCELVQVPRRSSRLPTTSSCSRLVTSQQPNWKSRYASIILPFIPWKFCLDRTNKLTDTLYNGIALHHFIWPTKLCTCLVLFAILSFWCKHTGSSLEASDSPVSTPRQASCCINVIYVAVWHLFGCKL